MDSPLELATSARVACARLETLLERGHRRAAVGEARKLWDRSAAMAGRIEDLSDEVERLSAPAPGIQIPAGCGEVDLVAEMVPPRQPPAVRPPGFEEVRERMRRRPGAGNPCAAVELPEDRAPRKKRGRKKGRSYAIEWKNTKQRQLDKPWLRVQAAYLAGRLEAGRVYPVAEVRRICGLCLNAVESVQLDLAAHRAPLRLVSSGVSRLRVRAA